MPIIQIRHSSVAGNVPVSLAQGEIGINEADGLLFYRGSSGAVTSFNLTGATGAPINSPVFTGDPKAPTPTAGDNDTSIATTAFVTTAIAGKADTSALAAKADLASPTFTGDPKAPTPTAGDNDTSVATTAFVQTAIATNYTGQCYLSKSGANLLLSPMNGNRLTINSAPQVIPDAGVTLAPTGNIANTFYYIYAYMSSGTMTLEYSTTGYAVQTGTGVKIKSGDPTRTLVGMAAAYTSNATWSSYNTDIVSLFNPRDKTYYTPNTTALTTTSTTLTAIAAFDIRFVSFAEREVLFKMCGYVNQTVNTARAYLELMQDGATYLFSAIQGQNMLLQPATASGNWDWAYDEVTNTVTETQRHSVNGYFATSTGTLTFNGGWSVTVKG